MRTAPPIGTPARIYGAGHIAAATAPVIARLGHPVTVVDDRPALATPERFSGCTVLVADPLDHARTHGAPAGPLLIMTHRHTRDGNLLAELLPHGPSWVGMLGSARKLAKIVEKLRARGISDELIARVRCPVGLGLFARTPAEVAVTIAAELLTSRHPHLDLPPALSADHVRSPLRAAHLSAEP